MCLKSENPVFRIMIRLPAPHSSWWGAGVQWGPGVGSTAWGWGCYSSFFASDETQGPSAASTYWAGLSVTQAAAGRDPGCREHILHSERRAPLHSGFAVPSYERCCWWLWALGAVGREQFVPSEFCRWVPCLSFNLVCRVILLDRCPRPTFSVPLARSLFIRSSL